ncbi:Thiamin pyrophosphokinase [Streptococcus oralis]|uniref:Thiamine diphosphokinase n=1 Tax=Streptococcus oralis TaxID=1303 RepID=A0A139RHD1_STROR|nr:thiamine diphosphokinase [Streptococcus oralis]KXU14160.1 Thiamin pyrophosphokinase [Streptococcus oralis]
MNAFKRSASKWTKVAVFAGGDWDHYRTDFDTFVGVDRGSLWILDQNLPLDMAVGDFDSVTKAEFAVIRDAAKIIVQAQPEKDDTDLELALLEIFGAHPQVQVTIFGALGGRIDHTLANVFLPSNPKLAPFMKQIQLEDGQNLISYCPEGVSQLQPRRDYPYLAFMPVRDSHLTILGAKYELTEENFFFKKVYASNEYIDREVSVTCPDGYVVVLHSKDRR